MKMIIFFGLFNAISFIGLAQNDSIKSFDTLYSKHYGSKVNIIDKNGLRQGYWVYYDTIHNNDFSNYMCSEKDTILYKIFWTGYYFNNKKVSHWTHWKDYFYCGEKHISQLEDIYYLKNGLIKIYLTPGGELVFNEDSSYVKGVSADKSIECIKETNDPNIKCWQMRRPNDFTYFDSIQIVKDVLKYNSYPPD